MQLLTVHNFLWESFISLSICNFHRKRELTVSFDLKHILNHLVIFYFFFFSGLNFPLPYGSGSSAPSVTDCLHTQP